MGEKKKHKVVFVMSLLYIPPKILRYCDEKIMLTSYSANLSCALNAAKTSETRDILY